MMKNVIIVQRAEIDRVESINCASSHFSLVQISIPFNNVQKDGLFNI